MAMPKCPFLTAMGMTLGMNMGMPMGMGMPMSMGTNQGNTATTVAVDSPEAQTMGVSATATASSGPVDMTAVTACQWQQRVVAVPVLYVYSGPAYYYPVVCVMYRGQVVWVCYSPTQPWNMAICPNGTIGWIPTSA